VTISLGVALAGTGEPIEAVIDRADRALYDSKTAGRDTVTVSGQAA
jgi:PleD family two-component response regulator